MMNAAMNSLYGSQLGQQQAAGNNMAAPPDPTLSSILAQFDNQIAQAAKALDRARGIADAVHGGEPTAVDNAPIDKEPGSMIARFQQRACQLDHVLGMLSGQIGRIERAL